MKKILKRIGILVLVAALITVVVIIQISLDYRQEMRMEKRKHVIYLPSSKYAEYLALGYQNIIADYLYLWSIQFFSEKQEKERFRVIDEVFDFITGLDPKYIEAYRIGALMMVKDVYYRHGNEKGIDMAFDLLEKGMEKNPDDWVLPFEAAQYAHFDLKNPEKAHRYYKETLDSANLPEFYERRIRTSIGTTLENFKEQDALKYWYNLYMDAQDEVTRNIAYAHFYDLKIDLDIRFIERAIEEYKKKYNRLPGRLNDLIKSKIVPALPYDPNGLPYLYDSTTGEVKPPKGYILKKKAAGG